jgi:hypothetical protein
MKGNRKLGKYGHKSTYECPLDKCNYTSRIMPFEEMDNKISNHSKKCPKHQLALIRQKH